MTHPEELFAGYVDGTLSSEDRVAVETHLGDCARCTRDVELAAGARSALRSMIEEPAPAGIASDALREAAGVRPAVPGGTPRWYRVGGLVAAAAAGLLVLSLVLPNIGQNDASDRDVAAAKAEDAAGGDAGGAVETLEATLIELRQIDYDDASLTGFTSSYRTIADGSAETGTAQAPAAPVLGTQAQTDKALACVAEAAPEESGELMNLIRARFKGTPAYFAVFFESPGADQPFDRVTVWVLRTSDCGILSFSSAPL